MIKTPLLSGLAILALIGQSPAASMSYNFFQGGFSDGASISGMFTAEDLNSDGQIVYFGPGDFELTEFMLTFSGNSLFPTFDAGLSDVFGFVWDVGTPILGDGTTGFVEGIGVNLVLPIGFLDYFSGEGPLGASPGGIITTGQMMDSTQSRVLVSPKSSSNNVPDGGTTLAMLGAGLAGIGVLRKKLGRRSDGLP